MIGQGLGPGFTRVATRRSVILSADGLELVLTFRCAACSAAASRDRSAPPMIPAEVLNRSRRPILPLRLNIAVFSSLSAGLPQPRSDNHSGRIRRRRRQNRCGFVGFAGGEGMGYEIWMREVTVSRVKSPLRIEIC